MALSCACEGDYFGDFCEHYLAGMSTVPAQCVAGMGSHGVVYNGTAYRTLDDAPPEGGYSGAPNAGCQIPCWNGRDSGHCYPRAEPNYLPLPPGYALAPPDADTIAVVATHGWSTGCAVTADGATWDTAACTNCGGGAGSSCGSRN